MTELLGPIWIVCGSRSWHGLGYIREFILWLPKDTIVMHGDARGADTYADVIAKSTGLQRVAVPANWLGFNKDAGPIRNKLMLELAGGRLAGVMAFRADGHSPGTDNMTKIAVENNVDTYVCRENGFDRAPWA